MAENGRTDARRGRAEPVQHHEMVGRYLEDHSSISRRDVAELCAISDPQGYRLLKKMESEGFSVGSVLGEEVFAMKETHKKHGVRLNARGYSCVPDRGSDFDEEWD